MDFEVSEYNDDRFKKIKIWIAHTGENLNNTVFELEALNRMSETLSYTPIVGYVEKDSNGNDDFSDHRQRIIIDRDGIEVEYMGIPWGLIPENHNAKIEYREGKEWVTAEGYLWTKFDKSLKILDKSNGRKSQSMEIDSIDGYVDDYGRLNIQQARFSGLCILGDEVPPAMAGSTIEYFTTKGLKEEMQKMLEELKFAMKGADDELDKDLEKTEVEVEVFEEEAQVEVDAENTPEETVATATEAETVVEQPEAKPAEDVVEPEATEPEAEFEKEEPETETEPEEEPEEVKEEPETNEKDQYIAQLEAEVEGLKTFKKGIERAEKEKLVEGYANDLTEESVADFKSKLDSYEDVESLEKDVVFSIFKNKKEAPAEEVSSVSLATYSLESKQEKTQFGSLEKYFN